MKEVDLDKLEDIQTLKFALENIIVNAIQMAELEVDATAEIEDVPYNAWDAPVFKEKRPTGWQTLNIKVRYKVKV